MADTPTSLAAELRRLRGQQADTDAAIVATIERLLGLIADSGGTIADLDRLAARVEALPREA